MGDCVDISDQLMTRSALDALIDERFKDSPERRELLRSVMDDEAPLDSVWLVMRSGPDDA